MEDYVRLVKENEKLERSISRLKEKLSELTVVYKTVVEAKTETEKEIQNEK